MPTGLSPGSESSIQSPSDEVIKIAIRGKNAIRLADMTLIKLDLEHAIDCFKAIQVDADLSELVEKSLWVSGVAHYFKCFRTIGKRSELNAVEVFSLEPTDLEKFENYKELREINLLHDENAMALCLPGAVLNSRESEHKIAGLMTTRLTRMVSLEEHETMVFLCTRTKDWVDSELDRLGKEITSELEMMDFDELLAQKVPFSGSAPD